MNIATLLKTTKLNQISLLTIITIVLIISAAFYARQLMEYLFSGIGRETTLGFIWIAFLAFFIFLVRKLLNISNFKKLLFFIIFTAGFAYAINLEVQQERVHIIKYAILAMLFCRDFSDQKTYQIILAGLIGPISTSIVDETIQHFLDYRVGDIRDVGFSLIAGIWGSSLYLCLFKSTKINQLG